MSIKKALNINYNIEEEVTLFINKYKIGLQEVRIATVDVSYEHLYEAKVIFIQLYSNHQSSMFLNRKMRAYCIQNLINFNFHSILKFISY